MSNRHRVRTASQTCCELLVVVVKDINKTGKKFWHIKIKMKLHNPIRLVVDSPISSFSLRRVLNRKTHHDDGDVSCCSNLRYVRCLSGGVGVVFFSSRTEESFFVIFHVATIFFEFFFLLSPPLCANKTDSDRPDREEETKNANGKKD